MSVWHPPASRDVLQVMVFLTLFCCLFWFFSAHRSLLPDLQLLPPLPAQPLLILSHSLQALFLPGPIPLPALLLASLVPCHLSDYIINFCIWSSALPLLTDLSQLLRIWKNVNNYLSSQDRYYVENIVKILLALRKTTLSEVLTLTLDTVVSSLTCFPVNYGYVARWKWQDTGKGWQWEMTSRSLTAMRRKKIIKRILGDSKIKQNSLWGLLQ